MHYVYQGPHKYRNRKGRMCVCACLCLCSPDEMFGSVNCGVINESTVHHWEGREEERDVEEEGHR